MWLPLTIAPTNRNGAGARPERLRAFLHVTWRPRQLARHATWGAMSLYLAALAVLAFEILPLEVPDSDQTTAVKATRHCSG